MRVVLRVRVRVLVPEAIVRVERGRTVHVSFVLCTHPSGPSLAVSPNGLKRRSAESQTATDSTRCTVMHACKN